MRALGGKRDICLHRDAVSYESDNRAMFVGMIFGKFKFEYHMRDGAGANGSAPKAA